MIKKILQLIIFLPLLILIQVNALPMIYKPNNLILAIIIFSALLYALLRIIKRHNLPLIQKKIDGKAILFTVTLTIICEAISILFDYLAQSTSSSSSDSSMIISRLTSKSTWILIVAMLTVNITGPILEELTTRGIIFQYSSKIFHSQYVGAILSSLIFSFLHGQGIILSISYFITSIILTIIFVKTKNIYSNILSHQLLNIMSTIMVFL